jgi:hypothetical protein
MLGLWTLARQIARVLGIKGLYALLGLCILCGVAEGPSSI